MPAGSLASDVHLHHAETHFGPVPEAGPKHKAQALLRLLDQNRDGMISAEEFSFLAEDIDWLLPARQSGRATDSDGGFSAVLASFDTDGDGFLEIDELWRGIQSRLAEDPTSGSNWLDRQWARLETRAEEARSTQSGEPYPLPEPPSFPKPADTLEEAWTNFTRAIDVDHVEAAFADLCRFVDPRDFAASTGVGDPAEDEQSDDSSSEDESEDDETSSAASSEDRTAPFRFLDRLSAKLGGQSVSDLQVRCAHAVDQPLAGRRVAVVGAGPIGLRSAVEAALLGAEVEVLELRREFSRLNIVKLWGWSAEDLLSLGAKTLLPAFLVYEDHIGIRELQALLLKVCLLLGARVQWGVGFRDLRRAGREDGAWEVVTEAMSASGGTRVASGVLSSVRFDAVLAADSGRSAVAEKLGIGRVRVDGKDEPPEWEIAVVVNFVNPGELEDRGIREAPRGLESDKVPQVKRIIYLQGETHYMIMTVERAVLEQSGAFIDTSLPLTGKRSLLASANLDMEKLEAFVRDVAETYSVTARSEGGNPFLCRGLEIPLDFWQRRPIARDPRGRLSLCAFPYHLNLMRAAVPMKVLDGGLPVMFVGDVLQEPFWPLGEGCSRGFIAALDSVWCLGLWGAGLDTSAVLAERQRLFDLATRVNPMIHGEEDDGVLLPYKKLPWPAYDLCLNKRHARYVWTVEPATRYQAIAAERRNSLCTCS